jgi:2-polyprenyl-6-methoxyphenol hydroxylase-like FAD-dependent oxidoreductase
VQEIVADGDRVTGIRGRAAGGATVTEDARIVIGADGPRSLVARSVQAPSYNARPALTCAYYSYWSGVPLEGLELFVRDGRFFVAYPTNDGLTLIGMEWPNQDFPTIRADIEGNFLNSLELAPDFASRVRGGTREERWVGTADIPFFYRKPFGPGWALVGDAGYHKDPQTAQGIHDAFRDAESLAEAIGDGLADRQPLDEALGRYERQRNEATLPMYEFTYQLAGLKPPPPDMQQLFGALRGNQADTNRFFGLIANTVPIPEFFAPENLQRIIGAAPALA